MKCSWVLPNLAFGSHPRVNEDFQTTEIGEDHRHSQSPDGRGSRKGWDRGRRDAALDAGLAFSNIPIEDFNGAELRARLPAGVAELDRLLKQGHTVYVHCTVGVSRSPTVVAAYFQWCLGVELLQVLIHLHACRHCLPDGDAIHDARRGAASASQLQPL